MYRLKKDVAGFAVVDGKFTGRSYKQGEIYSEIPDNEKGKFENVEDVGANNYSPLLGNPKKDKGGKEE